MNFGTVHIYFLCIVLRFPMKSSFIDFALAIVIRKKPDEYH